MHHHNMISVRWHVWSYVDTDLVVIPVFVASGKEKR